MLEVPCQHCMTPIEFPDEWAQRAIECPSCNQQTFLATVKNEPDSDAARSPKVQFVPPSDAPSPQAAGQGQQHGRVITINEWACNAKNSGAGAAIVGVLVIIIGMKTGIFLGMKKYWSCRLVSYCYPLGSSVMPWSLTLTPRSSAVHSAATLLRIRVKGSVRSAVQSWGVR